MMSHHPRRILTPGESRKRKEREAYYYSPRLPPAHLLAKPSAPPVAGKQPPTNGLLAGYLAFEYLTRGTLLGEKYDPSRAVSTEMLGGSSSAEPMDKKTYAEVANVLNSDGVHIPGMVNPTQLARWIKM